MTSGLRRRRCFIVAEAGSNHNGSLDLARRLIDAAADAGADAVKFQIFRAATLYPRVRINVRYLRSLGVKEGLYELIQRHEVPAGWIPELAAYCRRRGTEFLATPFDLASVGLLNPHVKRFKIATYESNYGDLIRATLATGKDLILSVGAMTEAHLRTLFAKVLRGHERRLTILQCVAKYPAPLNAANLLILPRIRDQFNVHVGFSDHTSDPVVAPAAAVALGATVVEKHFTLSRQLPGPDHAFALEPSELRTMVAAIRNTERALGSARKRIHPVERELFYYKRCYYFTRTVPAGTRLRRKDLQVLRNSGKRVAFVDPLDSRDVLGRTLRRTRRRGDILCVDDLVL